MEQGLLIFVALGIGAGGAGAWFLARRFGLLPGLLLPGLLVGAAVVMFGAPVGHPEEVMGRGILGLFVWLPLTVATVLGAATGLIQRLRASPPLPPQPPK